MRDSARCARACGPFPAGGSRGRSPARGAAARGPGGAAAGSGSAGTAGQPGEAAVVGPGAGRRQRSGAGGVYPRRLGLVRHQEKSQVLPGKDEERGDGAFSMLVLRTPRLCLLLPAWFDRPQNSLFQVRWPLCLKGDAAKVFLLPFV